MNIIAASSRGKGLREIQTKCNNISMIVRSGGKMLDLAWEASHQITQLPYTGQMPYVYFIAGLPDITTMKKKKLSGSPIIATNIKRSYLKNHQQLPLTESPISSAYARPS